MLSYVSNQLQGYFWKLDFLRLYTGIDMLFHVIYHYRYLYLIFFYSHKKPRKKKETEATVFRSYSV